MDPKQIHKFEQGTAAFADMIATVAMALYNKYKREGFTEEQAFILTRDYVDCVYSISLSQAREDG